jgi:hypothetical protein
MLGYRCVDEFLPILALAGDVLVIIFDVNFISI